MSNHPPVEAKVDNTSSAARDLTAAHTQQEGMDNNIISMNMNTYEHNNTPEDEHHTDNMENDNHVLENEGEIEEDVLDDEGNFDNDNDLDEIEPGSSIENLKQNIIAINEIHPNNQNKHDTHTTSNNDDYGDYDDDDDDDDSNDNIDTSDEQSEAREHTSTQKPNQTHIPDVGVENSGKVTNKNKGIRIHIIYGGMKKVTDHKLCDFMTIEILRNTTRQIFETLRNKKEIIFLWRTEHNHWRPIRDNNELTAVILAKTMEKDQTLKVC